MSKPSPKSNPQEQEQEPTFEGILRRMEQIAGQLESGEPKLEEALELFEEGVKLSKVGAARLDDAEHKLEVLLESGEVEHFPDATTRKSP